MLPQDVTAATAAPFAHQRQDAGAAAPPSPAAEDPSRLSGAALVAHIAEHHHAYARRVLPYVVALLAKVAACHRARNAKLGALCDAGEELAEALEARLDDEERDLFPALLAGAPAGDAVRRELDRMDRHQRSLGLLLARVRWLADDFAVPAWACRSYQALMEELAELEEQLLEHLHLERFVLGPHLSALCPQARWRPPPLA